jgi:hypothetical protein
VGKTPTVPMQCPGVGPPNSEPSGSTFSTTTVCYSRADSEHTARRQHAVKQAHRYVCALRMKGIEATRSAMQAWKDLAESPHRFRDGEECDEELDEDDEFDSETALPLRRPSNTCPWRMSLS